MRLSGQLIAKRELLTLAFVIVTSCAKLLHPHSNAKRKSGDFDVTGRQAHPQQFLKGTATLPQVPNSAANARLQLQEERFSIKSLWHAQPQHAALTDANPDASGVESGVAHAVQAHPDVPVVDNLEDILTSEQAAARSQGKAETAAGCCAATAASRSLICS